MNYRFLFMFSNKNLFIFPQTPVKCKACITLFYHIIIFYFLFSYSPFDLASFHISSISSSDISARLRPAFKVCSSR